MPGRWAFGYEERHSPAVRYEQVPATGGSGVAMARLTIWLLGFEVFSISNDDTTEDDAASLAGGTLGSTQVGFTARYELPDGAKRPEWEDE